MRKTKGLNRKETVKLKGIEIRIMAELMKNSRRSDREIAKTVGTSQPTVSRTIKKLEKEGFIREYTMVPDFSKLGFQIAGFTRFELDEKPYPDRGKARNAIMEAYACLSGVEGIGEQANRMFVNLYESYSEYSEAMNTLRAVPIIDARNIDSFLVDLNDRKSYRYLSMSAVANHLLRRLKDKKP